MLRILANFFLNGHHRKHLLCLMDALSTDSRHSYGYNLYSSSRRLFTLFV